MKTRASIHATALCLALGMFFTGAFAAEPSDAKAQSSVVGQAKFDENLDAYDTNRDGKLDLEELRVMRESLKRVRQCRDQRLVDSFQDIDANRDGKLTSEEIRAYVLARTQALVDLDTNGDGVITRNELPATPHSP